MKLPEVRRSDSRHQGWHPCNLSVLVLQFLEELETCHENSGNNSALTLGNLGGRGSSRLHEFSFSVFVVIVWYLFCCLGSLRTVSSSGFFFFFFLNRAAERMFDLYIR